MFGLWLDIINSNVRAIIEELNTLRKLSRHSYMIDLIMTFLHFGYL